MLVLGTLQQLYMPHCQKAKRSISIGWGLSVQQPCLLESHVETVDVDWPPPQLISDVYPVSANVLVHPVDTTHIPVIVLDQKWLRDLYFLLFYP